MASDLARLFALARNYYDDPLLYQSRADSYDIEGELYLEFIGTLMNAEDSQPQINIIARRLKQNSHLLLPAGINFLEKIIFSENRNYYQILGVGWDAPTDVIRKQYRQLIAFFHPDKCAARDLNGESYSALLNQAYNTLKKKHSRQAYDETLSYKTNANRRIKRQAHHSEVPASRKSKKKKPAVAFTDVFLYIPLLSRYPKIAVWGGLVAGFVLMIYLSSPDTYEIKPLIHLAKEPAIEISDEEQLAVADNLDRRDTEEEIVGRDYLEQTIQSDRLAQVLESASVVDINESTLSVEQSLSKPEQLPADHQTINVAVETTDVAGANESTLSVEQPLSRSEQLSAEHPTISVVMDAADIESDPVIENVRQQVALTPVPQVSRNPDMQTNDTLRLDSGFDGGPPGKAIDVMNLLATIDSSGKEYAGETPSMPPEMIMMQFIQGYEAGDIDGFSRLFMPDVRTRHGRGRQQLISQYSSLFDMTSVRKIQLKGLKIAPRNPQETILISDIEAIVMPVNETDMRHFHGEIVLRLITDGTGMQIAEIAHSVH